MSDSEAAPDGSPKPESDEVRHDGLGRALRIGAILFCAAVWIGILALIF